MVERFFFFQTPHSINHHYSLDDDDTMLLLSGPPSSGKTSLLFQLAFNAASGSGERKVVFICNRRRLEANPPFLSQGIDPSSDTFHRIHIKYVDDDEAVKKYFSAFHLHDKIPHTVIVDDFGDLFDDRSCAERYNNPRGRDMAMVRTLALCHNAILHANKTAPCQLVLCDTHHGDGDSPRLLFIYRRWISLFYTIVKELHYGVLCVEGDDGSSSFFLKKNSYSRTALPRRTTARYSIALQYLVLEAITQD